MLTQKNILIIRNDHIGDLVLSTAIFREIKKNFKNSKITLICSKINKQIMEDNPYVDKIIELEIAKYNFKTIWRYLKISNKIKTMNFYRGIDLRGGLMNVFFLLWLPGIKKRVSRIDYHPINKYLLTQPIKINLNKHIIEENAEIIEKGLNINFENNAPQIIVNKSNIKSLDKIIRKNKITKYVCFCPISGLKEKQWPIKKWKELIRKFKKNYQIILLGTSKDKKIIRKLEKLNKNCKSLINLNLQQMSLLFKRSSLVLAQDGGPMHIAWVSGSKVIEITSEANPIIASGKYFPLNHSSILIAMNKDIGKIKVESVINEIDNILKEKKRSKNKIIKI